jgi:cytochrome P450
MAVIPETIDLANLDAFMAGDHHRMFDWLRVHDPVYWQATGDGRGFWALTRYEDVTSAYREHGIFSSTNGTILGASFASETDTAAGLMLVSSDPPQQRQLRDAVHHVFSMSVQQRVGVEVTRLVDNAFDRALADGGCDFTMDIARELPAGALMGMLGISHDEARYLIEVTHGTIDFRDVAVVKSEREARLRLANAQAAIFEFFTELIRQRRGTPGDDLVRILLRTEVNGRPLHEEELLYNCLNITVGGNTTTIYSACEGLLALIENPDQYEVLLTAPRVIGSALDEFLRWSTPNAYDQRVAKRDVELHGKQIKAGDLVTLWLASANRDEQEFSDPHRFDVRRSPNRHIAFGHGIHRCIGNQFAHTELTILLERLVRSKVRFELAGQIDRIRSNFMLGFRRMPVRVVG